LVRGWWTAFLARAMVSIRCRPVLAVVADWLRLGLRLRRRGRELAAPILFCLPLHCRCLRILELEPIRRAARPVARAEPFGHDPPPSPSCRRGGTPPRLPGVQGAHLAAPRCGALRTSIGSRRMSVPSRSSKTNAYKNACSHSGGAGPNHRVSSGADRTRSVALDLSSPPGVSCSQRLYRGEKPMVLRNCTAGCASGSISQPLAGRICGRQTT
jgi:hypothetical protein